MTRRRESRLEALIPSLGLEEMSPALRKAIEPRVARLGYLGDFFRYAGHQPEPLRAALDYSTTLRESMPPRIAEVVILTVSARAGNRYEQVQHEPLALRAGLSLEEVRALVHGDAARCESFDEIDLAAVALACACLEPEAEVTSDALREMVEVSSVELAIGVLMMAGHYAGLAVVANALPLALPVRSQVAPDGPRGGSEQ